MLSYRQDGHLKNVCGNEIAAIAFNKWARGDAENFPYTSKKVLLTGLLVLVAEMG